MKENTYLFDTHALHFWTTGEVVGPEFMEHFDAQNKLGRVMVSSVSFWEMSLLVQVGRVKIANIHRWKDELLNNSGMRLIDPSVDDMIDSTLLPRHHKDPFDRLLIAQARNHKAVLVTRDAMMAKYQVQTVWL